MTRMATGQPFLELGAGLCQPRLCVAPPSELQGFYAPSTVANPSLGPAPALTLLSSKNPAPTVPWTLPCSATGRRVCPAADPRSR